MTPLIDPQPGSFSVPSKNQKVRVRSIGWLWFCLFLVLVVSGLCGAVVFLLRQEFVRVYADLERKTAEVSDRLTGIELDLRAVKKERASLSTDIKELKTRQSDLRQKGEALSDGWQKMKEATRAYQGSLQTIIEELRRKKEMEQALGAASPGASVALGVIEVDKTNE
jgi:septal ring factor EnvC (AmiA/AmiB activator)